MDSQNVTSGKGFPDAKSKKGFLPTGPYLVIPKDWRAFAKELHLQLSINGVTRQEGYAKNMVWNIEKILDLPIIHSHLEIESCNKVNRAIGLF